MSDENKAVVRRFVEQYQSADHDVSVAEELLAEDFVDHSPFGPFSPDRRGVIVLFGMFSKRFPTCAPTSRSSTPTVTGSSRGRPSMARTKARSWVSRAPGIRSVRRDRHHHRA